MGLITTSTQKVRTKKVAVTTIRCISEQFWIVAGPEMCFDEKDRESTT